MKKARQEVRLADFQIAEVCVKRAITGGLILEIPGENGPARADRLAQRMAEVFAGTGVRIARPVKRAEIRVRSLNDSVAPEEVTTALARAGNCPEGDIKIGQIRKSPFGLGSLWARAPWQQLKG